MMRPFRYLFALLVIHHVSGQSGTEKTLPVFSVIETTADPIGGTNETPKTELKSVTNEAADTCAELPDLVLIDCILQKLSSNLNSQRFAVAKLSTQDLQLLNKVILNLNASLAKDLDKDEKLNQTKRITEMTEALIKQMTEAFKYQQSIMEVEMSSKLDAFSQVAIKLFGLLASIDPKAANSSLCQEPMCLKSQYIEFVGGTETVVHKLEMGIAGNTLSISRETLKNLKIDSGTALIMITYNLEKKQLLIDNNSYTAISDILSIGAGALPENEELLKENLTKPFLITFRLSQSGNLTNIQCVSRHYKEDEWSTNSCKTLSTSNASVVCLCKHFGLFMVIGEGFVAQENYTNENLGFPESTETIFKVQNTTCEPQLARGLYWNVTVPGILAYQPCPEGAKGIAKWFCSTDATWTPMVPDYSDCSSLWMITLMDQMYDEPVVSLMKRLQERTKNSQLYGGDIMRAPDIINHIITRLDYETEQEIDEEMKDEMVKETLIYIQNMFSHLLNKLQKVSWRELLPIERMATVTSMHSYLKRTARLISGKSMRSFKHSTENIYLEFHKNTEVELRSMYGNSMSFPTLGQRNETVKVLELLLPQIQNEEARFIFTISKGFKDIFESGFNYAMNSSNEKGTNRTILNSDVVSIASDLESHNQNVTIKFTHLNTENVSNPQCKFYDPIKLEWSTNGCEIISSNVTSTTCRCNHFTNVALFMDSVNLDATG